MAGISRYLAVTTEPIKGKSDQIGTRTKPAPIRTGFAGVSGMMGFYHAEKMNRRIMEPAAGWDLRAAAEESGAANAIPNLYFAEAGQEALDAFFNDHKLTICSLPNDQHCWLTGRVFERQDRTDRFLYLEKPVAHTVEDALIIRKFERLFPGRIGIVGQNMLWDQAMEMKRRVLNGDIGEIFQGRFSYRQDWISWLEAVNSRVAMGPGARPIEQGGIGKLSDVLIHVISQLRFTTGQRVFAVQRSYIDQHILERPKRKAAAATYGTTEAATEFDKVGPGTGNFGDDALYAVVTLQNGAVISINIDQSAPGEKNSMICELSGRKGADGLTVRFDTDNPDELIMTDLGSVKRIEARNPGALSFTSGLAEWIRDGLQMNNPPLRWFTPPRHPQGWKEVHQRQMEAFGLYAQLVSNGLISTAERSDLYFVSTARQALDDMLVMEAIYASGASGKPVTVNYDR